MARAYRKKRSVGRSGRRKYKKAPRRRTARRAPKRRTVRGTDDYYNNPILLMGLKRDSSKRGIKRIRSLKAAPKVGYNQPVGSTQFGRFKKFAAESAYRGLMALPALLTGEDFTSPDFIRSIDPGHYESENKYFNAIASHLDGERRNGDLLDYTTKLGHMIGSIVAPSVKKIDFASKLGNNLPMPDFMNVKKAILPDFMYGVHDKINLPDFVEDGLDRFSDLYEKYQHSSLRDFAGESEVNRVLNSHNFTIEDQKRSAFDKLGHHVPFQSDWPRNPHTPSPEKIITSPRKPYTPSPEHSPNRTFSDWGQKSPYKEPQFLKQINESNSRPSRTVKSPVHLGFTKPKKKDVDFSKYGIILNVKGHPPKVRTTPAPGYTFQKWTRVRNDLERIFVQDIPDDLPGLDHVPNNPKALKAYRRAFPSNY